MVSKRKTRRKRGGSKTSSHSPANLPECTGSTRMHPEPTNAPCKSTPGIANPLVAVHDIGAATQWTGDHLSGIIKWAGDKIGGMTPAPKPKIVQKSQDGGARRRSNKKHTKSKRRTARKKHKRPKGSRADITPISREWQVKNHPIQINRFVNDPTIPDRGEKFDDLVHEMRHSGLTDGYFVIDYNSRRSPGHYGKYLISFSEALDGNLLPDATNYTGGYADNISAYELRQLRLRNERLERERQAEIERERLAELERQRELEREMAEAESLGLTLRELRTTRRMERIAEEEERQRRLQREMRQHYFENLPENEDVIVIEDPDGDINLGIEYKKPPTPQNEIPVTRPTLFQRMRKTINDLRRRRRRRVTSVRPTAEGNKKKRTRHHKRKKHKRKRTKKKRRAKN